MHLSSLIDPVEGLLQHVAEALLLPRFEQLDTAACSGDATRFTATTARRAEEHLCSELQRLLPCSRAIGVQQVRRSPDLRRQLRHGLVWLVDALDGSANFSAALAPFAMQVALLREGEALLAFVYTPLKSELAVAERGAGAFLAGTQLRLRDQSAPLAGLRGRIVAKALPERLSKRVQERSGQIAQALMGIGSTGSEYVSLVREQSHFSLYWRTLPWDHTAGCLLLTEAGGHVARLNGDEYRVWDEQFGLLAAGSPQLWAQARSALLTDSAELVPPAARPSLPELPQRLHA
jgi:fructose-1,6-bisphosphatase/inositol monophosphatase family enzyme